MKKPELIVHECDADLHYGLTLHAEPQAKSFVLPRGIRIAVREHEHVEGQGYSDTEFRHYVAAYLGPRDAWKLATFIMENVARPRSGAESSPELYKVVDVLESLASLRERTMTPDARERHTPLVEELIALFLTLGPQETIALGSWICAKALDSACVVQADREGTLGSLLRKLVPDTGEDPQ